MKFQLGDCVVAQRGEKEQMGIIFKATDASSSSYPDRSVYSVRFPIEPEIPVIFVWDEEQFWQLPNKSPFEAYFRRIMRKGETIWMEE